MGIQGSGSEARSTMKAHKFSYDEKCEELALYFTLDESSRHVPVDELAQAIQDAVESFIEGYDPTPWCNACGARFRDQCDCGPIASNE